MATVTGQVGVALANHTYWAYIPNPPLLRAVSWRGAGGGGRDLKF